MIPTPIGKTIREAFSFDSSVTAVTGTASLWIDGVVDAAATVGSFTDQQVVITVASSGLSQGNVAQIRGTLTVTTADGATDYAIEGSERLMCLSTANLPAVGSIAEVLEEVQSIAAGETEPVPAEIDRFCYPPPGDVRNTPLNRLLFEAYTRPVYAVVFGDSQERRVWLAAMNAEFRRRYGDSPGTTFMPLDEGDWESGRVWCNGLSADYTNGAQIGGPQAATSTTTSSFVASSLWTTTDGALVGWWVRIANGSDFEYQQVTGYVGSTRTVTVSPAFSITIPANVVIAPVDPRRAPPNIYGRAGNGANSARFLCRPDNVFGLDIRGASYMDADRTQQVLKLPDIPASLSGSDTINLRVVYKQTAAAPDATVVAKPHTGPLVDFFVTASATLTTDDAELQGDDFVSKVYAMPYAAGKPYMQAFVGSTASAATNPLIIVGGRYEVADSHGILVDSFSAGGYSARYYLDRHASMGDFFAALPTYEIALIHLGINDAYSQNRTATQFKTDMQELIELVKEATGCTVVVLINDILNTSGTGPQDDEFEQYATKMRELCDENTNVLMRDLRTICEESSFNTVNESAVSMSGAWSSATAYTVGQVVLNAHITNTDAVADYQYYQCILNSTNNRPPNATYWRPLLWKAGTSYTAGDLCYAHFPTFGWTGFFECSTTHSANAATNAPFSQYPEWIPVRQWLNDNVHLTNDGMGRLAALTTGAITATAFRPINDTESLVADIANGETAVSSDLMSIDGDTTRVATLSAALDPGVLNVTGRVLGGGASTITGIGARVIDGDGNAVATSAQGEAAALAAISAAGEAAAANTATTTILNRLGAWTGSGVNTILGAFAALFRKSGVTTPSDIGGDYDPATDSAEAIRDRGDTAWVSGGGASANDVADAVMNVFRSIQNATVPSIQYKTRILVQGDVYSLTDRALIVTNTGGEWPTDLGSRTWTYTATKASTNSTNGIAAFSGVGTVVGDTVRFTLDADFDDAVGEYRALVTGDDWTVQIEKVICEART